MIEAKIVRQGSLLSTTHLTEDELRALLVAAVYTSADARRVDLLDEPLDSAMRKLRVALDSPEMATPMPRRVSPFVRSLMYQFHADTASTRIRRTVNARRAASRIVTTRRPRTRRTAARRAASTTVEPITAIAHRHDRQRPGVGPVSEHDPNGHVILGPASTWICRLCEQPVELAEGVDWTWRHVDAQPRTGHRPPESSLSASEARPADAA
jgi:hypothetical protein